MLSFDGVFEKLPETLSPTLHRLKTTVIDQSRSHGFLADKSGMYKGNVIIEAEHFYLRAFPLPPRLVLTTHANWRHWISAQPSDDSGSRTAVSTWNSKGCPKGAKEEIRVEFWCRIGDDLPWRHHNCRIVWEGLLKLSFSLSRHESRAELELMRGIKFKNDRQCTVPPTFLPILWSTWKLSFPQDQGNCGREGLKLRNQSTSQSFPERMTLNGVVPRKEISKKAYLIFRKICQRANKLLQIINHLWSKEWNWHFDKEPMKKMKSQWPCISRFRNSDMTWRSITQPRRRSRQD